MKRLKMIEEKKKEFLGGNEDDLKELGFLDSDEEIDFSNFKSTKQTAKSVDDSAEASS